MVDARENRKVCTRSCKCVWMCMLTGFAVEGVCMFCIYSLYSWFGRKFSKKNHANLEIRFFTEFHAIVWSKSYKWVNENL